MTVHIKHIILIFYRTLFMYANNICIFIYFPTDRNYKRQDEWPVTLPPQPVRDRFAVRRDVDGQVISYRPEPTQFTYIYLNYKLVLLINIFNCNCIA